MRCERSAKHSTRPGRSARETPSSSSIPASAEATNAKAAMAIYSKASSATTIHRRRRQGDAEQQGICQPPHGKRLPSGRCCRLAHQLVAKFGPRAFISRSDHCPDRRRSPIGMAGSKWRIGIVFETQLDCLRDRFTGDLGHDTKAKVDPRRNPARGDHVPVFDHAAPLMCRANERQQLRKGPVGRCTAPSEEPSNAENEGAGAYRRHVLRPSRLPSDEFNCFAVAHRLYDTGAAAGHTDQVEVRTSLERVRGHQSESAVAWHWSCRFCHDVHRRLWQARQHLLRTRKVELRQVREDDKADVVERHAWTPLVLKRDRNSLGDAAIVRANARSIRRSEPKPQATAMVSTPSSVSSSLRRARSMRKRSTKSAGLMAKTARNKRLSER